MAKCLHITLQRLRKYADINKRIMRISQVGQNINNWWIWVKV